MLILTRRIGERVMIGDDMVLAILGIKGNQVRVGIEAPNDVTILREEVADRDRELAEGSSRPPVHD